MIVKEVKEFGNGAQVIVPKDWIGKKVIINLEKKTLEEIKTEIINSIKDLSKITSIFLIGSYARNENNPNSDIDIVVFSKEKIDIKLQGYDIIFININRLDKEIKNNPVLFKSILDEGIPIINSGILDEIKIRQNYMDLYKRECYKTYLINKKMLELDKLQGSVSNSVVYSAILRLRGLLILKNKNGSILNFSEWLKKSGIQKFNEIYRIYKTIRDNRNISEPELSIIDETMKLNELLLKELK